MRRRRKIGYLVDATITALAIGWSVEEFLTGELERAVIVGLIAALRIRFVIFEESIRRTNIRVDHLEPRR